MVKRLPKPPEASNAIWDDYAAGRRPAFFTEDRVAQLAKKYLIEPERVPQLTRLLESWADVYRVYKSDEELMRPGKIKAQLALVRAQAERLRETLENLAPQVADRFWVEDPHIGAPFTEEGVTFSPFGHRIHRIQVGPGRWAEIHIDREGHFDSLTVLMNYAESAMRRLPPDEGGRRRSYALVMWVHNVRAYWENDLGRSFTLKQGAGFCIEAFKAIDARPETARRLNSAIRHVLKEWSGANQTTTQKK